jgi:endonuclease-3
MDTLCEFDFHMQTVTSALAGSHKIRKVAPPHLLAMVSISSSYIFTKMRTSRVSRETARVVDALSSRGTNGDAPRRSLRNFAHTADVNYAADDASSDLSSLASSASPSSASPSPPPSGRKRKRTVKTEVPSPNASAANRNTNLPKKTKRQPAKRIKGEHGPVEPPPNWEQMYSITAEMRKKVLAPVDTMGCESLAERNRSPIDRRLQTLVALMLSSQTKDTVTAVAMKTLQDNLEGGFNLAALLTVEPERLNELIAKVGFHNNKTKYIKATAQILQDRFDRRVGLIARCWSQDGLSDHVRCMGP